MHQHSEHQQGMKYLLGVHLLSIKVVSGLLCEVPACLQYGNCLVPRRVYHLLFPFELSIVRMIKMSRMLYGSLRKIILKNNEKYSVTVKKN